MTKFNHILRAAAAIACAALAGCITTTPPTSVLQPMSVRPTVAAGPQATNGSIYQANGQASYGYRPLFEDRRARSVGDTLTVNIVESTAANKKSDSSAKRSSDNNFSVPTLAGLPGKSFLGAGLAATSDFQFSGEGAANSNNVFTGTITVTVTDILPNGNLVVSGEKQVGIGQGSEFIRLSGVVNPVYITGTNS